MVVSQQSSTSHLKTLLPALLTWPWKVRPPGRRNDNRTMLASNTSSPGVGAATYDDVCLLDPVTAQLKKRQSFRSLETFKQASNPEFALEAAVRV